MRMPFGLDLKSLVLGGLIAWFAIPWILGMIGRGKVTTNER